MKNTDNRRMIDSALYYASKGFAVFPLKPRTKIPFPGSTGFKEATKDVATIETWWTRNPNANIGIATGRVSGGVFVVDLDEDNNRGISGYESLKDWERDNGQFPDTANSITGRGGYHYFYKSKGLVKNRTNILDGIDIRGEGGYIVAPPSIHSNGNEYQWEQSIEEYDIAEADDTVYRFLARGAVDDTHPMILPEKITAGNRNDIIYKMCCSLQSKGISDETIKLAALNENRIKCDPKLDEEEVIKIANSAIKKEKGKFVYKPNPVAKEFISLLQTTPDKQGKTKNRNCAENIAIILRQDDTLSNKLRYDIMSYAPKYFGQLPWRDTGDTIGDWTDFDDSNLRAYIDTNFGIRGKDIYEDGINIILNENKFNPIRDYLEALEPWDGVERINDLLPGYLGVEESEYTDSVMHLYMQGAINRVYDPGCKFDYMLVLVGEQGIGKSEFLRRLSINDMWFDDNFNTVEGNQAIEKLRGKWILELAELLAMKRQKDVESIKAFVTTRNDNYREPYARRTTSRARSCVFAATTNDYNFLTDRTGNRRFLPITVTRNKTKSLFADDTKEFFDCCWAEAMHIYKTQHPKLVLSQSIQAKALEAQMKYLEEDPLVGMIQSYLDQTDKERICTMDIYRDVLNNEYGKPKQAESNRYHKILRNEVIGWKEDGRKYCGDWGLQRSYIRDEDSDGFSEIDSGNIPF